MPHPLDHSLDENFHQPKFQRRRSSLDNSCLAAAQASGRLVKSDDSEGSGRRTRRLSLNNTTSAIPTFLAELSTRPKKDLDMDWHESVHSRTSLSPSTNGQLLQSQMSAHSMAGGGSSNCSFQPDEASESSLDSSEDSFCDASAEEPANRIYLRKDLGASCFWSDDDMDEVDVQDAVADQDHEKHHRDWPKPGDREKLAKLPARNAHPRRRKRNTNPIKKIVDKVIGVPQSEDSES